MINSIQCLRAVAALMVLFFHAATMVNTRAGYGESFSTAGAAGVDIFFVISGFVIFLTTNKKNISPHKFIAKRIIRVGPPYWLYTSITVALLIFVPSAYKNLKFDPVTTISSYFFLLGKISDSSVGTVLGVGWTIAYEMYFYALVCISMLLAPRAPFRMVALVIAVGVALSFITTSAPAFTMVALSTLPLEFLAGCLIANLHTKDKHLSSTSSYIAIAIGFICIWQAGANGLSSIDRDPWRCIYFGIPAAMIVYGFVSIDSKKIIVFPKFLLLLGSASYSIYLCHQFVLAALGKGWTIFNLKTSQHAETLLLLGCITSIAAGLLSYLIFEIPVTKWLNQKLKIANKKSGL